MNKEDLMNKPYRQLSYNLQLAPFQEKWIRKMEGEMNKRADYIYALIQEDMIKNKHNPLRAHELKKLAEEFKFMRNLNYSDKED